MAKMHLKVYGTARKWHRERWIIEGKGQYVMVRRDKKGRVITWKRWNPTEPIDKAKYREISVEIEAETGRAVYRKIVEVYNQWEWVEGTFEVEY